MAFDHKLDENQLKMLASVFSTLASSGKSVTIDFGNAFIDTREKWIRAQAIQAASRVVQAEQTTDTGSLADMTIGYALVFEHYIDEGFISAEDADYRDAEGF